MTDEEFAALQAEFETETAPEGEPVAAGLSAEAQFAIDLATARAEETQREMSVISARLREQDYMAEKRKLADLGVPPYITELARPVLEGAGRTVELANGKTADAGQIMRKVLTEYAAQVKLLDLSAEEGSPFDEPETAVDEKTAQGRDDIVSRYKQMTGLQVDDPLRGDSPGDGGAIGLHQPRRLLAERRCRGTDRSAGHRDRRREPPRHLQQHGT